MSKIHNLHHHLKKLKIRKPHPKQPSSWIAWIFIILAVVAFYFAFQHRYTNKADEIAVKNHEQSEQISKLTEELSVSNSNFQKNPNDQKQLDKVVEVADARQKELIKQAKENPQGFLNQANLISSRDQFPEAVRDSIEQVVKKEGEFVVVYVDDLEKGQKNAQPEPEYNYFLKSNDQLYNLHFAQKPPEVITGAKVLVNGVNIGQEIVAQTGDGSGSQYRMEVIAQGGGGVTDQVVQKTAVVLVDFAGNAGAPTAGGSNIAAGGGGGGGSNYPISVEAIRNIFFGPGESVNNYYIDNSLGKISFSGDVFGWLNITPPEDSCNYYEWSELAKIAARNAGIDISGYRRQVFVFTNDRGCGYGGLGTIGGNPSTSWIFNYFNDPRIYNHELGHNLGIGHANSFECGSKAVDYNNKCYTSEYGDIFDVMGDFWWVGDESHHFNGPHKVSLGWIKDPNIQTITKTGTYTVYNIEDRTTQNQILKIPKPNTDDYYYISYRKKTGFDSFLPDSMVRGVSIHIWNDQGRTQTNLVDTTPGNGFNDSTLADGKIFYDPTNNITIKQISHNQDSATVEVTTAPKFASVVKDWRKTNSLPSSLFMHASAATNGYLYVLGGLRDNYSISSSVLFSKINTDDSLAGWSQTVPLPEPLFLHDAFIVNGQLLVAGGQNGSYVTNQNIYLGKINEDGTINSWTKIGAISGEIGYSSPGITVFNGYLYSINAYSPNTPTYFAKINDDGSLGAWNNTSSWQDDSQEIILTGSRDKLYAISRVYDDSYNAVTTNYSASVNGDGTISSWKKVDPAIPNAQSSFGLANHFGYLILTGGWGDIDYNPQRIILTSQTSNNGTLTTWLRNNPMPLRLQNHTSVAYNGYLYITGGYGGSYQGEVDNFTTYEQGNVYRQNKVISDVYLAKLPASILEQVPFGFLETITPEAHIRGWAYDPDEPEKEITVEFYVDKPYNNKDASSSAAFSARTDVLRKDVNSGRYFTGNHGFDVLIPEVYRDTNRQIYVYAVDSQNNNRRQLQNSPRGSLDANLNPTGNFEKITTNGFLQGWAYDPDEATKSSTVEFYFDAPYESNATSSADLVGVADTLRGDVNRNRSITGNHGFLLKIPEKYLDRVYHQVFAYMVDTKTGKKNRMSNSVREFNSRNFLESSPMASASGSLISTSSAAPAAIPVISPVPTAS